MDLAHALKVALDTGTVKLGLSETLDAANAKKAKLLIVARTCPDPKLTKERAIGKIPIYHTRGPRSTWARRAAGRSRSVRWRSSTRARARS